MRLRGDSPRKEQEVDAALAYIRHTTELERADTESASFRECFRGTNLRRTEIVRTFISIRLMLVADSSIELHDLDVSGARWKSADELRRRVPGSCRIQYSPDF